MRIKAGQHALDRVFDRVPVIHWFHIFGAHPFKHIAKQVEQPIGLSPAAFLRPGGDQGAHHHAGGKGCANARITQNSALHALQSLSRPGERRRS